MSSKIRIREGYGERAWLDANERTQSIVRLWWIESELKVEAVTSRWEHASARDTHGGGVIVFVEFRQRVARINLQNQMR